MINNTFSSKFFSEFEHKNHIAPDDYIYPEKGIYTPNDDLVLCRASDGTPTAIYGEDVWDLNPYSLSASKITAMHFSSGLDKATPKEREKLISEMKYLVFCLMYFIDSGHKGLLTPATLLNYFDMLRKLVKFCVQMKGNLLVGILSLKEVLSNKTYLSAVCRDNDDKVTFNKKMPAFLNHLASLSVKKVGFTAVQSSELSFGNIDSAQHPIIPIRMYLAYMDDFEERINDIYDNSENLTSFLLEFEDPLFGSSKATQKNNGVGKKSLRPTFQEAIETYKLTSLFSNTYQIKQKKNLTLVLTKIYFLVKNIIHLYTGMRSEEVLRLPYDCLIGHELTDDTLDDNGNVVDKARMINIISSTTKFEGYQKPASWLATEEVIKAVVVAKRISKAVSTIKGIGSSQSILFESPSVITHKKDSSAVVLFDRVTSSFNLYYIDKNDFDILVASDPDRNFQDNPKFKIGNSWCLTSHQFRRSLAYYSSGSGLVSMPTLKRQFKHMSLEMSRYYSRNFEQIKTIFGFYDEEKGEYVLPDGHMAYKFQMAVPVNMADQIISDVIGDDNQLFGKTGSFIERQKEKLEKGEINILEIRENTIKSVDKGELSYRSTLLGGCTKIGSCDTAMLGAFTECLTCEGSIIKMDLVEKQIVESESELAIYTEDSCEYDLVNQDLKKLKNFMHHKLNEREV